MLGPYGNTWVRTPEVDRLAAQSLVCDQAFACEPKLDAVLSALWSEMMTDRETILFTDDPAVDAHLSAKSFTSRRLMELPQKVSKAARSIESTQMAMFFGQAAAQLEQLREPFALYVHARGMAGPWDAPLPLREQFADDQDPSPSEFVVPPEQMLPADYDPDILLGFSHAYAGQVALFDICLGILLDAFEESPHRENTLLVLVGTRGYPLGEHLRVGECDAALYKELVHVPMLVRDPRGVGALERTQSLVTHGDLSRWTRRVLQSNEEISASSGAFSCMAEDSLFCSARQWLRFQSQTDRAIRTPAWLLRETIANNGPRYELYVKPDDLWEVNDIADRCPEIVTQLADVLNEPADRRRSLSEELLTSVD